MAKAAKMDKGQQKETLVKVLKYMKPYRFWLIAAIIMAIKTPKFIQEFMLGGGTGGISNVIVTTSKTMELSSQIKRKFSQLKKG